MALGSRLLVIGKDAACLWCHLARVSKSSKMEENVLDFYF